MDKWLWASRFFKTRPLAAKACELGRVASNGVTAKAARDVKVGDRLGVKTEGGDFEVEVLGLSEVRGPAPAAQTLYRETDESRAARAKVLEAKKLMPQVDLLWEGAGRPSKRDRRQINRVRGRG